MVAATSGYIKATPFGTFLGRSQRENSGNEYMGGWMRIRMALKLIYEAYEWCQISRSAGVCVFDWAR